MPEGPELYLASVFVNKICEGRVFSGKVLKSSVSTKNPDVPWCEDRYSISAVSRGKEVKLTLSRLVNDKKTDLNTTVSILFRFGMSGKFRFDKVDQIHKHAHLNFFTKESDMVLSFVDFRRFGRWEVDADWGKQRGPCVLHEYEAFRENVLHSLDNAAFNRPICETLLNQKFFNGIGNYLRAEILYQASIPPFQEARQVLQALAEKNSNVKQETPDVLELCHMLPNQVIQLSGGKGYDPEATSGDSGDDYSAFADWLQCYYNPRMRNMVDSNKRTIWFSGPAGPMAPKDGKSRGRKTKTHLDKKSAKHEETDAPEEKKSKLVKPTRAKVAQIAGKSRDESSSRRKRKTPNGAIKKEHVEGATGQATRNTSRKPHRGKGDRSSLKIKTETEETQKGPRQAQATSRRRSTRIKATANS